ncbi:MAG: HAD-IIIC family phosphatase [Bryobacteraceae bacterium]|nr:HAD-IIIC family phosphatase [Bryobacteraceae bacterium]
MTNHQASGTFRLAVAATFTADPLRSVISFWARELHAQFDLRFAPYNQVLQSLLNPASDLASNGHGLNVVLLRLEDLAPDTAALAGNVAQFAEELRAAPQRLAAPLAVLLCPSAPAAPHAALEPEMEALLAAALDGVSGVSLLRSADLDALYPVANPHSPDGERLGRIPYSEAWFCAAGTLLVRHAHALSRAPFKLVALDCDYTLWSGICGEDGPENVVLDEPRRHLHQFMLKQRADGVLLALASKNNEEDVIETFRVHPEFPLQLEHFVTWRLNWEPKSSNLASIAAQLSLGLDSFVFVDDNPKECAELSDALPQVLTLVLPADLGRTHSFLQHVWAFDHPVVTEEDRRRSAYYAQSAEFGNEVRRARSLADFMASIQLRVAVAPMTPAKLPRVAQLMQRTNQFNTTTIRRNESDVQALVAAGATILTADVTDRFGDYGLVGVIVLLPGDEALTVDSMLLSCRALGRGVEHHMLSEVGRIALASGVPQVKVPFVRSAKNKPALDFVQSLGEPAADAAFNATRIAQLEWTPAPVEEHIASKPAAGLQVAGRAVDHHRIACELSTVPDILEAMRTGAKLDDTMSETERKVAAIWADLLEKPVIRRNDSFFDLGGHSLVAVLLLMRIQETFGVELPIDDVYTGGLTLSGLAARIEDAQTGGIDQAEYAALLAEIESLTDEEARELLAQEDGLS